ncbi:MAG: peptide chain release factor N(5)-glutamine methyltransferase [Actinobacteria bacterium]|nr:peptide chain release factor N(5)-glutamine methyltransferase [Actinomycetota bacterium]
MIETVARALARISERLGTAGIETPRVDAEILLAHVLGTTRSGLWAESRRDLQVGEVAALERLGVRRETREPLAYVLGEWGFRRLTLNVDARVLVPRPETEVVVERCLARIAGMPEPRVLDVGTGSGAIALAIADEHPGARVTGIDASKDALDVAATNVGRTALPVELVLGDLFDGLPAGTWDLVVSNPPYVRPDEIESLAPEVRDWEPRAALVGEGATEAIADGALGVLRPGGALVLETAASEAGRVADRLRELAYLDIVTTQDLTKRDRVVDGVTTSDN